MSGRSHLRPGLGFEEVHRHHGARGGSLNGQSRGRDWVGGGALLRVKIGLIQYVDLETHHG